MRVYCLELLGAQITKQKSTSHSGFIIGTHTEHILKNDMFDQNVIVQERQKTVFRPTDNSFLFEHKIWMKEGYFPDKLILITGKINRVKSL